MIGLTIVLKRIFSPVSASFWATRMTLHHMPNSLFRDVLSDAAYRWPRIWMVFFWMDWRRGAFYYQWTRLSGGCGKARWMWRRPKNPRWTPAFDWWIFRG